MGHQVYMLYLKAVSYNPINTSLQCMHCDHAHSIVPTSNHKVFTVGQYSQLILRPTDKLWLWLMSLETLQKNGPVSNRVTSLMVRTLYLSLLLIWIRSLGTKTDIPLIHWNRSGVPEAEQLKVTESLNSIKLVSVTVMFTLEIGTSKRGTWTRGLSFVHW